MPKQGGDVVFVLLKAPHFQGNMFFLLQINVSETRFSCTDELHNSVNYITEGIQWMFQTGVKLRIRDDSHFLL